MVCYSYRDPVQDAVFEREFPMGDAPEWVLFRENGIPRMACRDIAADHRTAPPKNRIKDVKNWPMVSTAAGVAPDQAKEAHAKSIRDGVPTRFTKGGDAVFESRSHRKRYLKTIGMIDRNAGYGD